MKGAHEWSDFQSVCAPLRAQIMVPKICLMTTESVCP